MGRPMTVTTRDITAAHEAGKKIYILCTNVGDSTNDEIIFREGDVTDARAKQDIVEAFDLSEWPDHWVLYRIEATTV